jgi:hypothetical protein
MNATTAGINARIAPDSVVALAQRRPLQEFLTVTNHAQFLLVRLEGVGDELEMGLAGLQAQPQMRAQKADNAIGFHTVVADARDFMSAKPAAQVTASVAELKHRIAQARHFAISIEKRVEDAAYAERISVGRARNKDIVLRHASVSKFHAWLEVDAKGNLQVADAGSKNGTRVGTKDLTPRELVRVSPGETMRFGGVEATVCLGETFWRLISGG